MCNTLVGWLVGLLVGWGLIGLWFVLCVLVASLLLGRVV